MNFLKKLLMPLVILLVAFAVFFTLVKTKPKAEQRAAVEQSWMVNAISIKPGRHAPFITLYGQLITNSEIELTANVEATTLTRHVQIGETVSKNQLLFTFDDFTQRQQLALRQAEVSDAEAALSEEKQQHNNNLQLLAKEKNLLAIANAAVDRAKALEKREMASSSQLEDAKRDALIREIAIVQRQSAIESHPIRVKQLKARLSQAKARVALAKKELDDTEIRSPANGIVKQLQIDNGELVRKGTPLLSIIDTDHLEVKILIPEKYLSLLAWNKPQTSSQTDAYIVLANENIPLQLARQANNVEKGQAGSYVYFKVQQHGSLVLGGTYEIQLSLTPKENTVLLPHEALYGTGIIYRIVDEHLNKIPVEWLGENFDANGNKKILIRSPALSEGDMILSSKFANAIDGLKVTIRQ